MFYTIAELIKAMGLSEMTFVRFENKGKIVVFKFNGENKRMKTSKMLDKFLHVHERFVSVIVERVVSELAYADVKVNFSVVNGTDIYKHVTQNRYVSGKYTLQTNCLRHDANLWSIYASNPNSFEMLVGLNNDGETQGFAVIYTLNNGQKAYNRAYTTHHIIEEKFEAKLLELNAIKTENVDKNLYVQLENLVFLDRTYIDRYSLLEPHTKRLYCDFVQPVLIGINEANAMLAPIHYESLDDLIVLGYDGEHGNAVLYDLEINQLVFDETLVYYSEYDNDEDDYEEGY